MGTAVVPAACVACALAQCPEVGAGIRSVRCELSTALSRPHDDEASPPAWCSMSTNGAAGRLCEQDGTRGRWRWCDGRKQRAEQVRAAEVARAPLLIGSWGLIRTYPVKAAGTSRPRRYRAMAYYRDFDGVTGSSKPVGGPPPRRRRVCACGCRPELAPAGMASSPA